VNANACLHSGVLVNSGAVVDHDAICDPFSQLGVNASMAGGSRLGPRACLAPGEVLACGQTRFAISGCVTGELISAEGSASPLSACPDGPI
jgi:UDP-3-O-[3-hydroxymyristoyl] glucosamine N-acyltransferase